MLTYEKFVKKLKLEAESFLPENHKDKALVFRAGNKMDGTKDRMVMELKGNVSCGNDSPIMCPAVNLDLIYKFYVSQKGNFERSIREVLIRHCKEFERANPISVYDYFDDEILRHADMILLLDEK